MATTIDFKNEKVKEKIKEAAHHKAMLFDALMHLEDIVGVEVDLNSEVVQKYAMDYDTASPLNLNPDVTDEDLSMFYEEIAGAAPLGCKDGTCHLNHDDRKEL